MKIIKEKIYTIFSFLIFLFYLITLELSAGSYPEDQPYMHNPTIFKNFLLVISLIFIFIFIIILLTKKTKYFLAVSYTHLDVYKRQEQKISLQNFPHL